mmetsp:Transcript_12215/g.23388  ORF Transcript_12215/g.23388 Transcript_12215/m.23388 type:complete len:241 (-) Transcript_12215:510-1232(-)
MHLRACASLRRLVPLFDLSSLPHAAASMQPYHGFQHRPSSLPASSFCPLHLVVRGCWRSVDLSEGCDFSCFLHADLCYGFCSDFFACPCPGLYSCPVLFYSEALHPSATRHHRCFCCCCCYCCCCCPSSLYWKAFFQQASRQRMGPASALQLLEPRSGESNRICWQEKSSLQASVLLLGWETAVELCEGVPSREICHDRRLSCFRRCCLCGFVYFFSYSSCFFCPASSFLWQLCEAWTTT